MSSRSTRARARPLKTPIAFRPSLVPLEPRLALSHPPSVVAPVDPAYAALGAYPEPGRQQLAAYYAGKARRDKPPVVFVGDSTALLWGGNGPAPGSASWASTFAPLKAEDFGIAGDQTSNVLYRIEHGDLAGKPKVVVLQVGLNDLMVSNKTPTATAAGVAEVVHEIRRESPGTQVLVVGIMPTALPYLNPSIAQADKEIAPIGRQRNVTYLDPGRQFLAADGSLVPGVLGDPLHPGASGYQLIAAQLAGPVRAALRH